MALPPVSSIPPQLMGEYYRLAAIWASNAQTNPAAALAAEQQLYQMIAQNSAGLRTMAQSLMPCMSAALAGLGYAFTTATAIMAEVAAFVAGAIAAAGPVLLFILAMILLALLYWMLNNAWYTYVERPRAIERMRSQHSMTQQALLCLACDTNALSPLYTVRTRQLPPGMRVAIG